MKMKLKFSGGNETSDRWQVTSDKFGIPFCVVRFTVYGKLLYSLVCQIPLLFQRRGGPESFRDGVVSYCILNISLLFLKFEGILVPCPPSPVPGNSHE